jgi:Na+-translocating ferredoxin:NAD+ oxidoreductase RNF subunit RnfB
MKIDNAMTVFKELPKTNCRECGAKTCLAFAGAVFQRHKAIGDCPHLDKVVVEKFSDGVSFQKLTERIWMRSKRCAMRSSTSICPMRPSAWAAPLSTASSS